VVDFVLHELQDGTQRLLNLPPGASTGQRMTDLFPDCTIDGRLSALRAVVETGRPFELVRPATPTRPDLILSFTRTASGDVAAVSVPGDPRPDEATAERDAVRWQRLFEDTPLGICVATFAEGEVIEANRVLLAMLDRTSEEVIGARFTSFTSPGDPTRIDRERLLRTGHATMEKRYLRGDGRELWLRVASSLVVEDGEHRILSICEDVTEAHRARAQLAHRADHDALTGLPNRERLRRRLRTLLEDVRAGRSDGVGLLFLDLDRFKVINDSLGHAAGDRLLREVAARLQRSTPADDLLARLGGDEFALVTVTTGRAARSRSASSRCWRRRSAGRPGGDGRREHRCLGAGSRPGHPDLADEDALLREADTAMYAAKRTGEGPVVVFEDTCAGAPSPGSRTSRACAERCSATSCACTTSRSCAPDDLQPVGLRGARALAAPRTAACSGPAPSCRRRRRPVWSSPRAARAARGLRGPRGLAADRRSGPHVGERVGAAPRGRHLGDDVAAGPRAERPAAGRPRPRRSPSRRSSSATRGGRRAGGAARARLPGRAGRLRHRLQLAGLPAAAARRRAEDRPHLRHGRRHGQQRRTPALGHHRPRREPRAADRRRGRGDGGRAQRREGGRRHARPGLPGRRPRPEPVQPDPAQPS
jgi:diguanylate cyclase (GGDEF)-like protein/PAS domain S-box-containing protein